MHCPKCGHPQHSNEIRFCSKCGFDLKGVKELLAPEKYEMKAKRNEARITGFRQGTGLIIFGFLLTCVLYILSQLNVLPGSYSKIAFMSFLALGIARMCLPMIFGEIKAQEKSVDEKNQFSESFEVGTLPEAEYQPPLNFGTKNFETGELIPIPSVTERTTRNLEK